MKRLLACLAISMLVAACSSASASDIRGSVRDPAPEVEGFTLTEASNQEKDFPLKAPQGDVLLVFFGFTHCPDICPTTMADVRTAIEDMGEDGDRVRTSMVTVDPERDTAPVLTDYVRRFIDDGIALRTEDISRLDEVTKAFGASYEVQRSDNPDDYEVGHSAWLYAIDDQGRLRIQWSYGTPSADIANDLSVLLELIDKEKEA